MASSVKIGLLEETLIEELAQRNIHFMRPFGISKTPEGLRFAYVSGFDDLDENDKNSDVIKMSPENLKYVEEQYMMSSERNEDEGLIDIIFTWSWPHEMKNGNQFVKAPESFKLGPLMWHLKPRYIFTPSHDASLHFERSPYENVDMKTDEFLHASRFIALASAEGIEKENGSKKKWIYALNLVPGKFSTPLSLAKRPDDCTVNPFLPVSISKKNNSEPSSATNAAAPNYFFQVPRDLNSKRKFEINLDPAPIKRPPTGYVCKKCHGSDHFYRDCIYKETNLQPDAKFTYVCHICHEPGHNIRDCPKKDEERSERVTENIKISTIKHNNLPKSVAPETCWFCLSNPASKKHLIVDIGEEVYLALAKGPLTSEHLIIVPIEHVASMNHQLSEPLKNEIESFMLRVNNMLEGKKAIFFKLSNNPTHHMHSQAILIDSSRLNEFIEFLEDFSITKGYNFKPSSVDENNFENAKFEFAYVSDNKIIRLAHHFDPAAFFPAQYGRQVMANFLKIDGGADWKNQIFNEDDEKKFVASLKKLFNK